MLLGGVYFILFLSIANQDEVGQMVAMGRTRREGEAVQALALG